MSKPLREAMPTVTAIIDDLRANFGQVVVEAIRGGMEGQQTFHAIENGHEVGTPIAYTPEKSISLAECHIGPLNAAGALQTPKKG